MGSLPDRLAIICIGGVDARASFKSQSEPVCRRQRLYAQDSESIENLTVCNWRFLTRRKLEP